MITVREEGLHVFSLEHHHHHVPMSHPMSHPVGITNEADNA